MPVGKPSPDGEVVQGSRHYSGKEGSLGSPVAPWICPACRKQNEGRRPELGCAHCGSGDPGKSQAGKPAETGGAVPPRQQVEQRDSPTPSTRPEPAAVTVWPAVNRDSGSLRVLRLIEYLVKPGESAGDNVLRRSLVGRMDFPWGSITGTIIDSVNERQEDLLRLAHRQPGVWMANQSAMDWANAPYRAGTNDTSPSIPILFGEVPGRMEVAPGRPFIGRTAMELPDTGPAYTSDQEAVARNIVRLWGPKLANTIAMGLAAIAEELAAGSEPDKFLTREEALGLANALMHEIPADWLSATAIDESQNPPQTIGDM